MAPLVYSDPENRIGEILPKYLDNVTEKEKLGGIYTIAKGYAR